MKYFSVPADFKKETLDRLHALNQSYRDSKVIALYGSITRGEFFECGRAVSQLPQVNMEELAEYIHYAKEKNIYFDYTVNAPYMHNREFTPKGARKLYHFLKRLYEIGVRSLTVTLPSVMALVKSMEYDFTIKASTICTANNANKAMALKKMGYERMVVDQSINRDFHILRRIRNRFGHQVEMIVNTPCYKDCQTRLIHYMEIGGDSVGNTNDASFNYYEHMCMARRYKDVSNWLKLNWVRPEDLKYYSHIGINYFKLQGRQTIIKGADIVKTLECYFKEDYDGDLVELINLFAPMNTFKVFVDNKKLEGFIKPFVEKDNFCTRDCPACNYCETFAKKCINIREAEEINRAAKQFYQQYDRYNNMIKEINAQETSLLQDKLECDGDFGF
ncbi:MAG: U32 family peptidase [Candidatus Aminicenantes bacterium]|jgi:collagenase-like PrtC family protease